MYVCFKKVILNTYIMCVDTDRYRETTKLNCRPFVPFGVNKKKKKTTQTKTKITLKVFLLQMWAGFQHNP